MKRYQLFLALVKVLGEFAIVFSCFFLAREIRLVTDLIPHVQLPIQKISMLALTGFAFSGALLFVLVFALRGMYRIKDTLVQEGEFGRIASGAFSWFLYYIAIVYLSIGFVFTTEIPRLIIFFTLILSIPLAWFFRYLISLLDTALLRANLLPKRKIIILAREDNESILELQSNPALEIISIFTGDSSVLSSELDQIRDLIRARNVEEILSLDSSFPKDALEECFSLARIYGVRYRYADSFLFSEPFKTDISFFSGVPIVEIISIGLTPWGRITKRAFDIIASFSLIVALSPFLLVVALIVYLGDFHAPIYKNIRVGKLGKTFAMYKFRSMRPDADALKKKLLQKSERDGPLFKIEDDPRITKIGKFIRRFDIDELPQLFNVLFGDMSLVWPRPHLPEEVAKYEESQKRVLTLKPGITGMAQVNGRHKNSFADEVRLDVFYIENWSLSLDFKILFKTISVVLARGKR